MIDKYFNEIKLEITCDICDGEGGYLSEYPVSKWFRCNACNGSGYTLTDFGEKIYSLMRHNFRPMLEDAGED